MHQKRAISYHRFSKDGQSTGSIERQRLVTSLWVKNNDIDLLDEFADDGYSARTFDRPDMQKLIAFIKKHSGRIDYLLVAELTRFSRELGHSINLVEEIQLKHGVKIVSCSRNMVYDVKEPTSFFMMSIEFTSGKTDNLKRESDINGGIYTAKAKEGRFIGSFAPFGYKKVGDKKKELEIVPEQADVVQYIFRAYLQGVPVNFIQEQAATLGLTKKGNSAIQKMLSNPLYIAMQDVKPWKDHPGGLIAGQWLPIIDMVTWHQVQQKLKGNKARGITIADNLPLRGVLNCYCGHALTGSASRGKLGKYYDYYNCKGTRHTNISATYAHRQLHDVLGYLSLPAYIVSAVKNESAAMLEGNLKANKKEVTSAVHQLELVEAKLISIEEKFIANQLSFETYHRHYNDSIQQRQYLKAQIERLTRDENETYGLLQHNLDRLTDMPFLYDSVTTSDKQQLLKLVFGQQLYYREKTFRTPYLMDIFTHNTLILKQKKLLVIDEKREFREELPVGGAAGNKFEPLLDFLHFVDRVA